MIPLLCALFFLSGVAGLLFETLWFRQAGLAFGNSVWASSLVLSSFMAGLALGNGLAARFGARVEHPLRAYALLELCIGFAGFALVWRLPVLAVALDPMLAPLQDVPTAMNAARLGLAFGVLLVPATAMGATLPIVVAALRARDPSFGGALGRLYGWNTLGAVLGALLGELALLEWLGVYGTAAAAAACNGAAALGALAIASAFVAPQRAAVRSALVSGPVARILAAAFLAGGLLLALEVVWFRFLHLFVHSGSAAFAWMLASVLVGIGLGGFAGGAWLRRRPDAWRWAPAVALAAGAAASLAYAGFPWTSAAIAGRGSASAGTVAGLALVLSLPVALLSGVLFPLLGAGLARHVAPEARAAGWITLANTLGSASGSLVGGFVALPVVGMERSFFLCALGYAAVAGLAWTPSLAWRVRGPALAAFALGLALFPFGQMQHRYLLEPVARWHAGHPHRVLALREGRTETASIVERQLDGQPLSAFLQTDSFAMSSTAVFAKRYMKLYVHWATALRPEPKKALLISYGVGSTAKALVDTASLEQIDVVDISRDIVALSDVLYPDPASHPLRDPRVKLHIEDGRYFLRLAPDRYDLITSEPPPPKNAGVVNLYTREYFALIHERLAPGGVTTYWLPVHNLLESDAKAIIRGFCDVFADCALWVGHDLDWMLTGSRGGLRRPAAEAFAAQWRDPRVAPELAALGFPAPERLGATFLADAAWLVAQTAGTPPLTDAWPKRLSSTLQSRARAVFGPWMEEAAARERFAGSAAMRALWPEAWWTPTLDAFALQREVNAVARAAPLAWPERLQRVHALLHEPLRTTLVRWRLGVTADVSRATAAALAAGRPPGPHARTLGIEALSLGHFTSAARHFAAARRHAPAEAGALLLELYARGRAGDPEAAALYQRATRGVRGQPELAGALRWLGSEFGWEEA